MFDKDFFVCPRCKMLKSTRKSLQVMTKNKERKVYMIRCRCGWAKVLERPPKIIKKKKTIFS